MLWDDKEQRGQRAKDRDDWRTAGGPLPVVEGHRQDE